MTVQPASFGNFPVSKLVSWPESTNKVFITVQCPSHKVKFSPSSSRDAEIGFLELYGTGQDVGVFCTGTKKTLHPVGPTGPCTGITGTKDTLTIEWTDKGVQLMREEEVIISQVWEPTDGYCISEKSAHWSIKNYGSTVVLSLIHI